MVLMQFMHNLVENDSHLQLAFTNIYISNHSLTYKLAGTH